MLKMKFPFTTKETVKGNAWNYYNQSSFAKQSLFSNEGIQELKVYFREGHAMIKFQKTKRGFQKIISEFLVRPKLVS